MKRSGAEAALPPSRAQRRQKASTPRSGRASPASAPVNARKGGADDMNQDAAAAAAAAAAGLHQASPLPVAGAAAAAAEEVVGWGDGAAELVECWWCLWGVEEDKLSGWFPFVDEDFLCSDARGGGEGSGCLPWEEADHDIWQLQHIHEIPNTSGK